MVNGKGTKTAVEDALAIAAQDEGEERGQIELLGLPVTPGVVEARSRAASPKGGRPPGARNKRTIEFAHYLLSRYTSPLEVLAQIATARTEELAASLGCTKLEALQERRLAAIALKDHLHSKMPIAVDVNSHKIIHLTIGPEPEGDAGAGGDDNVLTLTATVIKDSEVDK